MSRNLAVIVLAAGQGTRMKSSLPKVLHEVCGVPMATYVLAAARGLNPAKMVVVVGHRAELVRESLALEDITFIEQRRQLGTADAVRQCRETTGGASDVLVLNGDSPFITSGTLEALAGSRGSAPLAFLSCLVPDSGGFGRVQRDGEGTVTGIIEQTDGRGASFEAERNAGQYLFDGGWLWTHIDQVGASPTGEFYLTDLAAMACAEGTPPIAIHAPAEELMGFDDRIGLAEAEGLMRRRILRTHMLNGVTISDPATTYIDAHVTIAQDVTLLPNTTLTGATAVGSGSRIGPNAILRNARVGERVAIGPSVVEDSTIADGVRIGPFCHVRGNSTIGEACELGNYAEVNRSRLGRGVKMHHFSYLGDATVGDNANIAAGVITCNFDGVNKNPTVIGEGAFVGCDTMLVAPVEMGAGSQTGAGTVLRESLPPGMLAVGVPARILRPRAGA